MHLSLFTLLWIGGGWLVAATGALLASAAARHDDRVPLAHPPLDDAGAAAPRAPVGDRVVMREVAIDRPAVALADRAESDDAPSRAIAPRRADEIEPRAAM